MTTWEDGTPKSQNNAFALDLPAPARPKSKAPKKPKRGNPLDIKRKPYFAIVPTDMHKTTRIMRASI